MHYLASFVNKYNVIIRDNDRNGERNFFRSLKCNINLQNIAIRVGILSTVVATLH
jgi:hypothetical protein